MMISSLRTFQFKYLFLTSIIFSSFSFGQSIGWEGRTNAKEYLNIGFKGFELRHRTDEGENRLTYARKFFKDKKVSLKIPIHYKFEKEQPTLEPRVILNLEKFKIWAQKELWIEENYNAAFAIDYPHGDYSFRFGWDTSETFRFGISYKLKKKEKEEK